MWEPKNGNFFERHRALLGFIAVVIIAVAFNAGRRYWTLYNKYDKQGIDRPGLHIDKAVEDTGEYVERNEHVFVTREDKSYVGKHVRFIAVVGYVEEDKKRGKYIYAAVDPAVKEPEHYVLMSDKSLMSPGGTEILEIDGLVTGRMISENENVLWTQRSNIPVLEVVDAQQVPEKGVLERIVPAEHTVEPSLSASGNGVSVCLERVDYCDTMTRFYVRVENKSDWMIFTKYTAYRPDGEALGTPTEISYIVSPLAHTTYSGEYQAPGTSNTSYISKEPIGVDEGFVIRVNVSLYEGESVDDWNGSNPEEWEWTLTYAPE